MHFRILGPLEVLGDGGEPVAITSPKQQALLALLIVHANEPVAADRIADQLWPEADRTRGLQTMRYNLSKLRALLKPAAPIETVRGGYRLVAAVEEVDSLRFDALLHQAAEHRLGRPDKAVHTLTEALGLWRGPALAGYEFEPFAEAEIRRLEERRLSAIEDLMDVRLRLGEYRDVVSDAEQLVADHPLREEFRALHMRALAASGRRGEALRAYRSAATYLGEELGIEPGPQLRELEERILMDDPAVLLPPKAVSTPSNLPADIDRFVGRTQELEEAFKLVVSGRLTTLLGVGGIGKTRLALAAARQLLDVFDDGVWLVDIGPLRSHEQLWTEMLRSLGVSELPGATPEALILDYLSHRRALLVLDNCEHLLDEAGRAIEAVLHRCPGVSVLMTSRVALGWPAEVTYAVPPLGLPDLEGEGRADAAVLFRERAAAVAPHQDLATELVDELVTRLEGIPLAIELAASRLRVYALAEILEGLDDRFALLDGQAGGNPGHPALRSTLDWSYELLDTGERALLNGLTPFRGSFTRSAIEAICTDEAVSRNAVADLLQTLVVSSWLVPVGGEPARFRLLDTVREYARDRLDPKHAEQLDSRFREFFVARAEETRWRLLGPDRAFWLDETERDRPNLLAAFQRSLDKNELEPAQRLVSGLAQFWGERAYLAEGTTCADSLLDRAGPSASTVRCEALNVASWLAMWRGAFEPAERYGRQQWEDAAEVDDPLLQAGSRNNLANLYGFAQGRPAAAIPLFEEALQFLENIAPIRAFPPLMGLAYMRVLTGSLDEALATCDRIEELANNLGYVFGAAAIAQTRAWGAFYLGDLAAAEAALREASETLDALGIKMFEASTAYALASVLVEQGQIEEALPVAQRAVLLADETAGQWRRAEVAALQGRLHVRAGHHDEAKAWTLRALSTCQDTGQCDAAMYALAAASEMANGCDDPATALWLDGASQMIRTDAGLALPEPLQIVASGRRREGERDLGEVEARAAFDSGENLSFGQAIEGAIERIRHC